MLDAKIAEISLISNWTAKRAGAGVTIEGLAHPAQLPIKITDVERIECIDSDGIFAVLKKNQGIIRLRGAKKHI